MAELIVSVFIASIATLIASFISAVTIPLWLVWIVVFVLCIAGIFILDDI